MTVSQTICLFIGGGQDGKKKKNHQSHDGHTKYRNSKLNFKNAPRVHYYLGICFVSKSSCDCILRWGLWEVIGVRVGQEGRVLMMGLVAL